MVFNPLRKDTERIGKALGISGGNPGELEVTRYHGFIVGIGDIKTKDPNLPDWDISYVEYPEGEMHKYRDALQREHIKIVKVTARRIYFEQ